MKALLLFLALLIVPFIAIGMNNNATHAEEITLDVPFKVAQQDGQTACTLYFDPEDSRIQVMRCYFTNLVMDETYQPAIIIPIAAEIDELLQDPNITINDVAVRYPNKN